MDRDERQLVCHLFAQATAMLEDAHGAASEGQSAKLRTKGYRKRALRLRQLAQDVESVTETILAVVPDRS